MNQSETQPVTDSGRATPGVVDAHQARRSTLNSIRLLAGRLAIPMLVFLLADLLISYHSLYTAAWIRFDFDLRSANQTLGPVTPLAASYALCIVIGLFTMGLYRSRQRPTLRENVARVAAAVVLGGLVYAMLVESFSSHEAHRVTLAIAMLLSFLLLSTARRALLLLLDHHPAKRRVLIVGSGRVAARVGMLRRRADRRCFEVVGFIPCTSAEREFALKHRLGPLFEPHHAFVDLQFDEVVVALDDRRGAFPTAELLRHRYLGVPIRDIVSFLERETGKIDLDVLRPAWLIFATSRHGQWGFRIAKRTMDLVVGTMMLMLTTPLILAVAVSIWIEEGPRSPLLYKQRRVSQDGRVFKLLKFRSMCIDAEKLSGPLWAPREGDDRVTRTGRLIRRFRIDELPQLVNVIRGEMSVVGPRPERPEFVGTIAARVPLYEYRHCMKPGLTGWAQLNFPYAASVEDAAEKLKYDLYYVKNASFLFDLFILMQTLEVVIWGRAVTMAGYRSAEHESAFRTEAGDVGPLPDRERRDVA
jgi:sugar transferase (PEP-CTERM system associated)